MDKIAEPMVSASSCLVDHMQSRRLILRYTLELNSTYKMTILLKEEKEEELKRRRTDGVVELIWMVGKGFAKR